MVADAGNSAFVETGATAVLVGSAAGGSGPYTFSWSAPAGTLGDADGPRVVFDAAGVAPGTVDVTLTATDSAGRTGTDTVKVAVYALSSTTLLDEQGDSLVGVPDELLSQDAGGNADRQSHEFPVEVPIGSS